MKHVSMWSMARLGACVALCAASFLASTAAIAGEADPLKGVSDPTRPPLSILRPAPAAAGASAAEEAASAASAPAPMKLTSIRYDMTGGGAAILNDQVVGVGDKVGTYTVVAIHRDAVVITGPKGERRLSLLDESEKTGSMSTRAAKRGRKESK